MFEIRNRRTKAVWYSISDSGIVCRIGLFPSSAPESYRLLAFIQVATRLFFFLGIVCKIIHSLCSKINHLVRAHSIVTRVIFSEDYDCPYM